MSRQQRPPDWRGQQYQRPNRSTYSGYYPSNSRSGRIFKSQNSRHGTHPRTTVFSLPPEEPGPYSIPPFGGSFEFSSAFVSASSSKVSPNNAGQTRRQNSTVNTSNPVVAPNYGFANQHMTNGDCNPDSRTSQHNFPVGEFGHRLITAPTNAPSNPAADSFIPAPKGLKRRAEHDLQAPDPKRWHPTDSAHALLDGLGALALAPDQALPSNTDQNHDIHPKLPGTKRIDHDGHLHYHQAHWACKKEEQEKRENKRTRLRQLLGNPTLDSTKEILRPENMHRDLPHDMLDLPTTFLEKSEKLFDLANGDVDKVFRFQRRAVRKRTADSDGCLSAADLEEACDLMIGANFVERHMSIHSATSAGGGTQRRPSTWDWPGPSWDRRLGE